MAILAFPLVISFLKPQASGLSLLRVANRNHHHHHLFRPRRRFAVSAISTSSSSSSSTSIPQHSPSTDSDSDSNSNNNNSEAIKSSVPTFQQAIQRLQEYWGSVGCAVMQCSNAAILRLELGQ